jgi:hypothetical protein
MLFGAAPIFIPVIGRVVILGPLAAAIVATIEGGVVVGVISALGGALSAIGIPKNSVLQYERRRSRQAAGAAFGDYTGLSDTRYSRRSIEGR